MDQILIRTDRLELRELQDSDFEAVHAYASDPVVVRYMPWGPNQPSDTSDFLTRVQAAASARPRVGYELAVTLIEGGTLLGAMGLHRENAEAPEAMLGYCFGQPAWGKGYATESGLAMVRFGFTHLGLETIWAGCDEDNAGSISVLKKLGMVLESRHEEPNDGAGDSHASLMFRIRADWTQG